MVVPLVKLFNQLIGLAVLAGFGYIIYAKVVQKRDIDISVGSKFTGDDTAFRRGKI